MQTDDGPDVWEQLRATRWSPPTPAATTDERRATYVFALEQAEQMFRAAATVGVATRPVLVFYGLSQAGRAIAAAAASVESGDGWRLKGHGIRAVDLSDPLPDIEVRTGKRARQESFVRLSEILDSPLWGTTRVRLGQLWDLLPENEKLPLVETDNHRRTPLWIAHGRLSDDPHPLASVPVVGFPPWVLNAASGRDTLREYLEAFPEAQTYESYVSICPEPDASPAFMRHLDGWGELIMNWRVPEGGEGTLSERLALLERLSRQYNGTLYFFPVVPGTSRSTHPLMAWWAVLYTLSMLARYQPAEWASHINVDRSPHAVGIERLLNEAIRMLPRLVAEAIDAVAC